MGVCKIFGAGERVPESRIGKPENGDLVIAADGGYAWLCALAASEKAFLPKLFIGDFDSADAVLDSPEGTESEPLEEAAQKAREAVFRSCERTGTEVIELPIVKDDTDTGVCVREGLARGLLVHDGFDVELLVRAPRVYERACYRHDDKRDGGYQKHV